MKIPRPNLLPARERPGRLAAALALWLLLFAGSILLYNYTFSRTSPVLVHRFQIVPAAVLLEWTLPGVNIVQRPTALALPGLEVHLLRGCDGMEAWLMLMTALLVFPFSWRRRLLGALWGSLLVFGLNLVRIVSLFHVALRRPQWFEIAHDVLWQCSMVIFVALFILAWFRPDAPLLPRSKVSA